MIGVFYVSNKNTYHVATVHCDDSIIKIDNTTGQRHGAEYINL